MLRHPWWGHCFGARGETQLVQAPGSRLTRTETDYLLAATTSYFKRIAGKLSPHHHHTHQPQNLSREERGWGSSESLGRSSGMVGGGGGLGLLLHCSCLVFQGIQPTMSSEPLPAPSALPHLCSPLQLALGAECAHRCAHLQVSCMHMCLCFACAPLHACELVWIRCFTPANVRVFCVCTCR